MDLLVHNPISQYFINLFISFRDSGFINYIMLNIGPVFLTIAALSIVGSKLVLTLTKMVYRLFDRRKKPHYTTGVNIAANMLKKHRINVQGSNDRVSNIPGRTISIYSTDGLLTDHYRPKENSIYLSKKVAMRSSLSSMAIAAHEVGHVIQDKDISIIYKIRSFLIPIFNTMSQFAIPTISFGILLNSNNMIAAGFLMLFANVIFSIITVPVELQASVKGYRFLKKERYIYKFSEKIAVIILLLFALFTYIVGVITSFSNSLKRLLYYILRGRRGFRGFRMFRF